MNNSLKSLDSTLELYLVKKAPALPRAAKEAIVQFSPWIVLILLIISLPAVLALFGLGTFLAPLAFLGGVGNGISYLISMVILAISLILEAMAIPGLFKRERKAWDLVFYSVLLSALSSLLSFHIISMLVSAIISLYFLYQVKEYYK